MIKKGSRGDPYNFLKFVVGERMLDEWHIDESSRKNFNSFLEDFSRLVKKELRITFFGAAKRGKSTIINYLLHAPL